MTDSSPARAPSPDADPREGSSSNAPSPLVASARTASTRGSPTRVLPIILLGSFLAQASYFLVSIALPVIGRSLDAGSASLQVTVAGYSIGFAGLLVAAGRLGDRFGRRRLFIIGLLLFAITSASGGLATDGWTLAVVRLMTGAAAGLITPQVLGTIQALFVGSTRQRALGAYAAAAGLAVVVGQLVGGLGVAVDEDGGWRAVLLITAVLAVAFAVLAAAFVPETRGDPTPVDGGGAVMLMAMLALLIVPLGIGREAGWPLWTWASLAAGVLLGYGFIRQQRSRERVGRNPLLPPSLFRQRAFRNGLLTALPFFAGVGGSFFLLPIAMQRGLNFGPLTTALALVPFAVAFLVTSLLIPRFVASRGGPAVVTAGAFGLVVSYGVVTVTCAFGFATLTPVTFGALLVLPGIAQAAVLSPLFGTVLGQMPVERAGFVSGVLTTTQQAAIAIGVGVLGTVFFGIVGDAGAMSGDGRTGAASAGGTAGWAAATTTVFAVLTLLAMLTAWTSSRIAARRPTSRLD